jgi:hypothetical protein
MRLPVVIVLIAVVFASIFGRRRWWRWGYHVFLVLIRAGHHSI